MRFFFFSFLLMVLGSCATTNSTLPSMESSVFEAAYYQDLQRNIVRLHHLLQGTFTAHSGDQEQLLTSWTVSGGDSVVLYSVPLGDVNKDGYWIYSYEFMTSLPDAPIYTSIKRLKQVSRDTVDVYYYKTKEPVEVELLDLLDLTRLNAKINLDSLILRDKKVRYGRKSSAHFIGKSLVYEDPDRHCLRQNTYDVSPSFYQVETIFYDKQKHSILDIKNRPNLLVRRAIETKVLHGMAQEG